MSPAEKQSVRESMKERLTDERILSFNAAPEGKRLDVFDTQLPGLVLRITDKGVKSFAIRYRHKGRTQRYTIGKTPPLKLKKAREIAYGLLASARQGQNPMAEKREARKAIAVSIPVEKAIERYLEIGLTTTKEAHRKEVARLLRKEVAGHWKGRGIASIDNSDVLKLLDSIEAPSTKRHVYFNLRSFFNWCKGRYIKVFPIDPDFIAPAKGGKRDRVLDSAELKSIWIEVTSTYSTYNAIIQLLILTGQRRDEIAEAEWNEFDFAKKIWTLPAERTKEGKKAHRLPLSPLAVRVLQNIPRTDSPYLFPSEGNKRATFSNWSKGKEHLDDKSKTTNWTLHDLRRTVSTMLASKLRVFPHVIESIIDHASVEQKGVGGIYNRASYEKEMRDALKKWADFIADLATAPPPKWKRTDDAQVVKLKAALERRRVTEAKALAVPLAAPKLKGDRSHVSTSSTASLLDTLNAPLPCQKVAIREFKEKAAELPAQRRLSSG